MKFNKWNPNNPNLLVVNNAMLRRVNTKMRKLLLEIFVDNVEL